MDMKLCTYKLVQAFEENPKYDENNNDKKTCALLSLMWELQMFYNICIFEYFLFQSTLRDLL